MGVEARRDPDQLRAELLQRGQPGLFHRAARGDPVAAATKGTLTMLRCGRIGTRIGIERMLEYAPPSARGRASPRTRTCPQCRCRDGRRNRPPRPVRCPAVRAYAAATAMLLKMQKPIERERVA